MREGDTISAQLYLHSGHIQLYTTEVELEGHTRLSDQFPIAMSLVRPLLTKHGLAHIIPIMPQ